MLKWLKKITGPRWSIQFFYGDELRYALHDESVRRLTRIMAACYQGANEVTPWSIVLRENVLEREIKLNVKCYQQTPEKKVLIEFIQATFTSKASKKDEPISKHPKFEDCTTGYKIPMRSPTRDHSEPKRLEDYMISSPSNALELFANDSKDDFLDIMSLVFEMPEWRLRYQPSENLPDVWFYINNPLTQANKPS